MGPDEPSVHHQVEEGRHALHTVDIHSLRRLAARHEDLLAARDAGDRDALDEDAEALRQPRRPLRPRDRRRRAGILPPRPPARTEASRHPLLRTHARRLAAAARPEDGRPLLRRYPALLRTHARRLAAAARPEDGGPLLRRDSDARPLLHGGRAARPRAPRRRPRDAPQRKRALPVRVRAAVHRSEPRLRPEPARHGDDAQDGARARAAPALPREALRACSSTRSPSAA